MIDIQGSDYSSAIASEGVAFTHEGEKPFVNPRPLETEEIPMVANRSRLTLEREIYWLQVGTLKEAEALLARSFTVVSLLPIQTCQNASAFLPQNFLVF